METSIFIDPRDMESSQGPMSPPESVITSTPPPDSTRTSSSSSKKKRKSWGQVLPEPTTTLPPRKRAKTDAEKQQRMYERVQRNRAAAHNSRMRKQEEMDHALVENNTLKQDLQQLEAECARLREENRRLKGPTSKEEPDFTPAYNFQSTDYENTHSPSAPSLTSGSSDDTSSNLDHDQLHQPPTPQFNPDPILDTKRLDDSRSAVDVEAAGYHDGFGLGIGDDMTTMNDKVNFNDFQLDMNNCSMPITDPTIDTNDYLNLDGLVDSQDFAQMNQDWFNNGTTGFDTQIQYDPSTFFTNTIHDPTPTAQPLF